MQREEVWREASGVARTAFAAHTYDEAHGCLGRHPRLIEPVMQILGGPVYMHQYKINAKAAFDGEVWQWHQDYGTWKRDDEMPEPRAMNIAVFLDDVTAANGPLLFIPGSHKAGTQPAARVRCGSLLQPSEVSTSTWNQRLPAMRRLSSTRAACWARPSGGGQPPEMRQGSPAPSSGHTKPPQCSLR